MSGMENVGDGWEDRYQYLVEEAEDMLYLLDEQGRYVLVNDSMAEMTGYDKEEIIGNTPSMLLSEEDLKKGENQIKWLLESESQESSTWTVTLITKDGQRIPCDCGSNCCRARTVPTTASLASHETSGSESDASRNSR